VSAAVEILNANENEILDLYDRSLLRLVDSDKLYGKVENPEFWLYSYSPVRGYVENTIWEDNQSYDNLGLQYGQRFSE
jgi:hypothetical protein